MDNHTIVITIDPNTGELKSTVKGIKGNACSVANKWVDEIGQVTHDEHTPEFYEEPKKSIITGYSTGE